MTKRNYLLIGGIAAAALGMWWRGKHKMALQCCEEDVMDYGTIIYRNTPLP